MTTRPLLAMAALLPLLAACGGGDRTDDESTTSGGQNATPIDESVADLPQWLIAPTVDGAIASSGCVPASQNLDMDMSEARTWARTRMAQMIETRVDAMATAAQRRIQAESGTTSSQTFDQVTQQLTETALNGARQVNAAYVDIEDRRQFCVQMAMPMDEREVFQEIVAETDVGGGLSPQDEAFLYEEFRTSQSVEEMRENLSRDRRGGGSAGSAPAGS